jgi:hypothetical protein
MVMRACVATACTLVAGCHLVLGYEGSYEEREANQTGQSSSGVPCLCEPGEEQACGNCGTQICNEDCVWGACEGGGPCAPGSTEECGGGCGVRVCSDACTWCGCPADSCASCDGAPAGWLGCRGNGCSVCADKLAAHPCYFQNHPDCAPNVACDDEYYECSAKCPPPSTADACMCPQIGAGFWVGCMGSGCQVCADIVKDYACYFVHHPLCVGPDACEGDASLCNSELCPPATEADKGTLE